jgi:hypothetical protein
MEYMQYIQRWLLYRCRWIMTIVIMILFRPDAGEVYICTSDVRSVYPRLSRLPLTAAKWVRDV